MDLVYAPAEILKKPTISVDEDMDNVVKLAEQMHTIMAQHNGIGLAAPQVGLDKSFFIMGDKSRYKLIVNPKIIEKGDEEGLINEGCLSFPGLFLKVLRPLNVVVEYVNTNGDKVNEKLEGMMSRVFQHETDHLNGITFDTLVSKLKLDMAMKKLNKRLKHNG
jgi:peptide deformylase|tara:strand:- start:18496 stop:18984 length:489 start_codon:yes stop_codon:yes gene_type:complete